MEQITLLTLACCTAIHFVLTCVMAIYARHQIQYLCLAWVNGLFFTLLFISSFFSHQISTGLPGCLHPVMLLSLVVGSYLQSIYPLSIPMPAYLQWGRMWKYASPAILLILVYIPILLFTKEIPIIHSTAEISTSTLGFDFPLRIIALLLSVYYIVNIFRLPHTLAKSANLPHYIFGYCTALGLTVIYYVFVSVYYTPLRLMIYIGLFTLINMYLTFRVLETMAIHLPKPSVKAIKIEETEIQKPTNAESSNKEFKEEDFNKANFQRFQRVQLWMLAHKEEWTDNTFGRDRLCEQVGINRHLLLQSVRSQGFNNVHDYINSFRIEELKTLVQQNRIKNLSDCLSVGFGTLKTARTCFMKSENISLDEYIEKH